jgi:tetratricopeptide (TPR) repeat protein
MRKRLFSILLAQCMVLCLVPITAFAEDSTEETPVCTCEIACTEETMNAECPVCGAESALVENCGKYVEPAAEGEASQPEGEELQENHDSDMPDTQSEAALAQMSGEGENGIAVQSAGVTIDNTNFPDANFRTVVKKFDTNQDSSLSDTEIAAVKKINCSNKGITNLKGIEYFTSLNILWCTDNQLTALDVSENTALTKLNCCFNKLTSLDVSKNTALTILECNANRLTALDVSKNTALTELNCSVNKLTSLDVSKNTALTELYCNDNQLTSLDVSKNTALISLSCVCNQLTSLDVSKNTALTKLNCSINKLTALDVSKNMALTELYCNDNQLTSLDLSNTNIMNDPNCGNNIYQIVVDNDPTFDLSILPGNFVVANASDWSGGTVSGNMLTVDSGKDTVTYKYDCGKGKNVTFTLKFVGLFADYTKVDEAITKAKALNKDDYKDFSAVDSAVNAVVRDKNVTEQSEVDKMAKAIEDAIAALQYKEADYTKVDEAIAKANALNKDDYKDFSAVEAAINAVVRDKNITEQSEVDAMAKAIEDAIAALQYKGADYTKVDEAIAKANALNKDNFKDFSGVEAAVNAVVRDKNFIEQSEVDKMAKAIEDAIAALQYKDADYTKVDEAIAKANALKKDEYKDFSGVEAAVNAVVRGKNITEQSEVDAMAKAIEDAIAALEKKSASTKPGTSDKSPQTGDTSNIALWIALLFVSGGAAIGTTVVSRKKKYNK